MGKYMDKKINVKFTGGREGTSFPIAREQLSMRGYIDWGGRGAKPYRRERKAGWIENAIGEIRADSRNSNRHPQRLRRVDEPGFR